MSGKTLKTGALLGAGLILVGASCFQSDGSGQNAMKMELSDSVDHRPRASVGSIDPTRSLDVARALNETFIGLAESVTSSVSPETVGAFRS